MRGIFGMEINTLFKIMIVDINYLIIIQNFGRGMGTEEA